MPSQPTLTFILDTVWLHKLHSEVVERSSGFSVEQLQQMNAAVMGAVWKGRGEWNRMVLAEEVRKVFDACVEEIIECQRIAKMSQETDIGGVGVVGGAQLAGLAAGYAPLSRAGGVGHSSVGSGDWRGATRMTMS